MSSRAPIVFFVMLAASAVWTSATIIGAASVGAFASGNDEARERLPRNVDASSRAAGAGVQGNAAGRAGPSGAVADRPRGAARVFFDKPTSVLVNPARRPS